MKKERWLTILGFLFLAIIGFVFWKGLSFFVFSLTAADPKISAAIVGAMATVFVGLTAVIITQRQTKIREVEEAHRTKKVEIYEKFLQMISSLLAGQNDETSIKAPTEQNLVDYLVEFKTEILLWGSPEVIKCQLEFEDMTRKNGDLFLAVNNLYKAIRKDIGLSNKGLNNLELVKMYLKDPEELDKLSSPNN